LFAQALGNRPRCVQRCPRHQHQEFLPTNPRQVVDLTHIQSQGPRHVLERQIAHRVAEAIVDQLEVIDIEHQ
jgi:hypothetical protein